MPSFLGVHKLLDVLSKWRIVWIMISEEDTGAPIDGGIIGLLGEYSYIDLPGTWWINFAQVTTWREPDYYI